jgi:hypothetical protein
MLNQPWREGLGQEAKLCKWGQGEEQKLRVGVEGEEANFPEQGHGGSLK